PVASLGAPPAAELSSSPLTLLFSPGVATCHVAGDPHYYTFDGKMVSFMGTCTYTLVALCQHDPRLPLFNITAKNEERGQPEASYLRHVMVHVQGVTITLQKSRRVLVRVLDERERRRAGGMIDGQRVRVPVEDRIPGVSIIPRGIYVVIETEFGLVVKFDGNHHLEIQMPGTYFGKVCGMCGNFNNQSADDYLMPNGHQAANDSHCQPDNRPDLNPSCSGQELEHLSGLCLEIMTPKYQACHSLVDPKLFFQNCLYDMCQYQGMPSVLCDNIQSYVETCKSHGVTGISWRNSTFCPLPCPPNSHFSECASPCPATCSNLYAPASCLHPAACVEGCDCDPGYVLSDLTCVTLQECGCLDPQQEYHHDLCGGLSGGDHLVVFLPDIPTRRRQLGLLKVATAGIKPAKAIQAPHLLSFLSSLETPGNRPAKHLPASGRRPVRELRWSSQQRVHEAGRDLGSDAQCLWQQLGGYGQEEGAGQQQREPGPCQSQ
ncbi:Zonadhesin, partial [Ophiophagus hannah]